MFTLYRTQRDSFLRWFGSSPTKGLIGMNGISCLGAADDFAVEILSLPEPLRRRGAITRCQHPTGLLAHGYDRGEI